MQVIEHFNSNIFLVTEDQIAEGENVRRTKYISLSVSNLLHGLKQQCYSQYVVCVVPKQL